MKALKFENGKLFLDEAAAMPNAAGESLVRVSMSGICNTDIEIVRGYAGFEGTIGHEFVGVVEDSPARPELVGKRVIGEINAGCGKCEKCRGGDPRHCLTRTVLGIHGREGCHAEYISLPAENLLIVPDSIPDEAAVFAEPLAAAYGITEQVEISADTKLAVIGDGKLGLLCAMALFLKTNDVTLIGRHPEKMAIAAELGIKTMTTNETAPEMNGAFDAVVEASGNESGFAAAADLVRPRGKIVLKSTFAGSPRWEAAKIVVNEITVVGSRCGRFAPAIDLLTLAEIPVKHMIEKVYTLGDGVAAMEHAARKGTMKILLKNAE
jgi:threonine dehydrogenase-like Zn-dependent dehydrogenase